MVRSTFPRLISITAAALAAFTVDLAAQSLPWNQLAPGTSPSSRERASLATDGTVLYLYGGQVNTTTAGYDNLWSFNGSTWTQLSATGASCGPRSNPGMAWDAARQKLVIFGGMGNPWGTRVGDTWEWSAATGWVQATPATNPGARWLFNMVYVPGIGCVFHGGNWIDPVTNVAGADSTTWAYDGNDWSILSTTGPDRSNGKLIYRPAQHDLIYFGGTANGSSVALADTWRMDLSTGLWSVIPTATSPTSSAATGGPGLVAPGMCVDGVTNKVIMHGGQGNGGQPSTFTWEFDGSDWKNVSWTPAPAVRNTDLVWLPALNKAYLACGNFSGTARNQTWSRGPAVYGSFIVSGTDCASGIGRTPLIGSAQMPALNSSFVLDFADLTPGTLLAAFVGSSNVVYSGIPLPLPMAILFPGSGAGCALQVAGDFGIFSPVVNGAQTGATLTLAIPSEPLLLGLIAYTQGVQIDVAGGFTASNTKQAQIVLGRF